MSDVVGQAEYDQEYGDPDEEEGNRFLVTFALAIKIIFAEYSRAGYKLGRGLEKPFFNVCKKMKDLFQQAVPVEFFYRRFLPAVRTKPVFHIGSAIKAFGWHKRQINKEDRNFRDRFKLTLPYTNYFIIA